MAGRNIGFIGVGRMGGPMSRRLIEAGFDVTVYDSNPAAVRAAAGLGAHPADSPASVASAAGIVFASLPTPPIVEAVALGPNGVIQGTRVKVFIDASTTGSTAAKRVAEGLGARGIAAVDAPVSGGVAGAERGALAIMVSCPREIFGTIQPILQVLGKPFHVGAQPGQGQTMKLLNNLLSATAMAVSSEAVVMGVKAGLDPKQMIEVINAGSGRNSATQDKFPRYVIPRTFNCGFALGLLSKDIRLCLEEAEALGIPMLVGSAVRQLLSIAAAGEGLDADMTSVVKTIENWAGVRVGEGGPAPGAAPTEQETYSPLPSPLV